MKIITTLLMTFFSFTVNAQLLNEHVKESEKIDKKSQVQKIKPKKNKKRAYDSKSPWIHANCEHDHKGNPHQGLDFRYIQQPEDFR